MNKTAGWGGSGLNNFVQFLHGVGGVMGEGGCFVMQSIGKWARKAIFF